MPANDRADRWPELVWDEWKDTATTLHMWTQIVGKIRLARTPWINHSWHVPLYVTSRGLTTSPIPYDERSFQIDFDFIDHRLLIDTCDGDTRHLPLRPRATAEFHAEVMSTLDELGLPVRIHGRPNEVEKPVPFAEDRKHTSYDPDAAWRFWRVLVQADRVLTEFRARFLGKCSPVHFFWGSFDLAVTRFSGRPAPEHPGGFPNLPDWITREAYSHEVSSAGLWFGADSFPEAIFYSYAYPTPEGFGDAKVRPAGARWVEPMGEFALPYEAVRRSATPSEDLMEFLQSTYEAAADLAGWNRPALERPPSAEERPK